MMEGRRQTISLAFRALASAFGDARSAYTSGRKPRPASNPMPLRWLIGVAGLWENWRSPAGEWMHSFAIITTKPNELCAELHDRMPLVLGPSDVAGVAQRETGAPMPTQILSRALSIREDDLLAGERARRQCQEH